MSGFFEVILGRFLSRKNTSQNQTGLSLIQQAQRHHVLHS